MRGLAQHLECDASNVTGLADRLEELGVVERVPGADRRVKLLRLTRRGATVRADLEDRVAAGSTVTAKLTALERTQLMGLLDKLLA
jgi:DNA-binding MarR family transcriptional regulator